MTCLGACVEALGGTGNPGEDWKSALIKEASEKLRLRMEQNFLNDKNGSSVNNSYLIEIKGASSKKYVGDWLDERGDAARLFSDLELSGFDKTLLGLNTSKGLVDQNEAVYLVVINDWKLFLETKLTEPSEINNLNQFNAQEKSLEDLRLKMGEVPLQIINEVSAAKQRQNVHLYLFSRINVFDRPDEKNQKVSPRSFIYTSFSESRQRLLLKGVSELNILGRAGLIRQNLEILEGYYADGTSATTGNSLLSRSFSDHVQEKKYGDSQAIKSLVEEITKELDKRQEALLKDYGKVKVEELSAIKKLFFLHNQEINEKNLGRYLALLKEIEKGAAQTEEWIKNVNENNYEELQNISRLTDVNISGMLSWEAREKLLKAWAEKEYLADNGWMGYDERKVIELLAKAPRIDSEQLITFFKANNHKYLLKFYGDLNDAGGIDHNTLFIETLVEVSKQLLKNKIETANGSTEAEKIFDLFEKGDIKGIFYSIPSSDCQPFGFSENSTTSYKITSKWCYCSGIDLEAQIPCEEKVLSSVDDLSPLDLAIIVKGKDLSVLQPEYYQGSEFQAEVVPAIYFKYGQKERSIEVAKNVGAGVFTVASVVIPGTLMVRAMIAGRYLAATIAAADLVANTLAEIAHSTKVQKFIIGRYGPSNGNTFINVTQTISLLTGNVNAPVKTVKAVNAAEEITKITRKFTEVDLKIFVNISDDLSANVTTLAKQGEVTAEQIAEIKKTAKFVKEDLAKSGKGVEKVVNGVGNLLNAEGKFIDNLLETDYVNYLTRKATQGKTPKGRLNWKEARDYWLFDSPMARGNSFNKKAFDLGWYDYFEINLANGKRLDSYVPPSNGKVGEIISRKATNLEEIELSTFENYLKEMQTKYPTGTTIRSNKYPVLDGQILQGKQILEIPISNQGFSQIQDYIDLAKNNYNIEIRFRPE